MLSLRIVSLFFYSNSFYNNAQMADIYFIHGKANGNTRETCRLYKETRPGRCSTNKQTFYTSTICITTFNSDQQKKKYSEFSRMQLGCYTPTSKNYTRQ